MRRTIWHSTINHLNKKKYFHIFIEESSDSNINVSIGANVFDCFYE